MNTKKVNPAPDLEELKTACQYCLSKMPQIYTDYFLLVYNENMNRREIALTLDKSLGVIDTVAEIFLSRVEDEIIRRRTLAAA